LKKSSNYFLNYSGATTFKIVTPMQLTKFFTTHTLL